MSAMGINAACTGVQADPFVSVTVAQTSVLQTSISFNTVIAGKINEKLNSGNLPVAKQTGGSDTKVPNNVKADRTDTAKGNDVAGQTVQKDRQNGIETGKDAVETEENGRVRKDAPADPLAEQGKGLDENELNENDKNILEALACILQTYSELLDIPVDELKENIVGIEASFTQITTTSVIAALVTGTSGNTDPSSILYSDDLFERFRLLLDKAEEILDSFSLTGEQFENGLKEIDIDALLKSAEESAGTGDILEELENIIGRGKDETADILKKSPKLQGQKNTERDSNVTEAYSNVKVSEAEDKKEQSLDTGDGLSEGKEKRQSTESTTVRIEQTNEEFIAGLSNAIKGAPVEETLKEMGVTVREIVDQIVEAVKVSASPDNTSLEVSLTPENLGKVRMDISSKGGVVTAQITTENQTAKAAIEGQLQILKEAIEAKGITVEAIEVTVSSFSFKNSGDAESNNSEESGSKKHKNGLGSLEAAASEAPLRDGTMNENDVLDAKGSTVSFVA